MSTIQNIEEADDLTQEVFIQVFKSIDNFKEKSSLSTWIYRITLSKCYEHIRYKREKKDFHSWLIYLETMELVLIYQLLSIQE